jgi:hypothetical protein
MNKKRPSKKVGGLEKLRFANAGPWSPAVLAEDEFSDNDGFVTLAVCTR